jgi:hypothetical protein
MEMRKDRESGSTHFIHVKTILAGLLSTTSHVQQTMQAVFAFDYGSEDLKQHAVMNYLDQLGVPVVTPDCPEGLMYTDLIGLFNAAFPRGKGDKHAGGYPVSFDYDQDNCQYTALISHAVGLDQNQDAAD